MAVTLNSSGLGKAHALISAGKVDETSDWSFTADDGNALLGDPPDWGAYGQWFLGTDSAADHDTKDHWKYPFGKGGKLYRSALRAIASRASAQDASDISNAASELIKLLDAGKAARPAMRRAYSTLVIKQVDDDQRIIEGIASTPTTDRMGDIVEPDGAQFTLPLPLLWQHDSEQPIGQVLAATVTAAGIAIRAQIAKNVLPQIDNAWALIKAGLVRGLSIGFCSIEESDITGTWGTRFTKWDWLELSAVTIPANADANIQTIKSCDTGLAATGGRRVTQSTRPGDSGAPRIVRMRQDTTMKKPLSEQIATWEATRAAKAAKQASIQQKALDEGRAKDASEKVEFDTLEDELKSIDAELADLRTLERREAASAVVVHGSDPATAAATRSGSRIAVERKLPKGIAFARYAMCVAASRGSVSDAVGLAKRYYPDDPGIVQLIERPIHQRAAVGAGATDTSHWADDLVPYNVLADFIEYLRPGSIIGKFGGPNPGGGPDYPQLRKVPFNVRVSGFNAGTSANWIGEGLPNTLSKATSFNQILTWAKVGALAVLTKEEVRFSNPSAEAKVRDDIARAVNTRLDVDFVDPAKAAVANVSPASITHGVAAVAPTGTTAAFLISDIATLLKEFTSHFLDASDVLLIMSASQALEISMMTTTLGAQYFPNISMLGGNFRGIPVVTSENLQSVGSPSTNSIVAVKAGDVYLADDGVVTVEASDQASIEMVDTSSQSGISGTGASLVSLWQSGLLGLKAEREITWAMRRAVSVAYISPAAYSA